MAKDYYYKYYSAETALLVLENTSIKWSSPSEFNDPFDNQFRLILEEVSPESHQALFKHIFFETEWPTSVLPQIAANSGVSIEQLQSLVIKALTEAPALKPFLDAEITNIMHNPDLLAKYQNELDQVMSDVSIFCVSESYDNILMWSHYANNHKGVVLSFSPIREVDSPLLMAKPVHYTEDIPQIQYTDLLAVDKNHIDTSIQKIQEIITLTKSLHWSYEREWRVISGLRDPSNRTEICKFAPEELEYVYLGCQMEPEKKAEILTLLESKYPHLKVYQANKSLSQFTLEFQEIT